MKYAEVEVTTHETVPVARIEGEVDTVNSAEVSARLVGAIGNVAPGLVVDLTETTYVDSAALQLLLDLNERLNVRGQKLRLVVPAEAVIRRLFELTHVNEAITIDGSLEEALAGLDTTSVSATPST